MKFIAKTLGGIAALALAAPAVAGAQSYDADRQEDLDKARGVKVQAQGGIISYPGEAAATLSPGAAYGVLVGIEPLPIVELELGYQGAAFQTDERLAGAQENVVENGGQALVMVSPNVGSFEPYAFGGYQLSRFNVYERDGGNPAVRDDTLSKVPVGVGLDYFIGDFTVGARGQYNFLFNNDAILNVDTDDSSRDADQIAGTLQVGAQF